jgi:hypothetical protein
MPRFLGVAMAEYSHSRSRRRKRCDVPLEPRPSAGAFAAVGLPSLLVFVWPYGLDGHRVPRA